MESAAQISEKYKNTPDAELQEFVDAYASDGRKAVVSIVNRAQKRMAALEAERARMFQMFSFERQYAEYAYICGIDEVGRGPLAGPVVAGAVILPKDCSLLYLNDSKQLSEKKREELYDMIMEEAIAVGLGFNAPERIDEINILQATYEAMREAISKPA